MPSFDLAWFTTTPYGQPFALVDEATYNLALILAEDELAQVKCNCPHLYEAALQIKIALILGQMAPGAGGGISASSNSTGKIAFVTQDQVMDTTRQYELVDEADQVKASNPANILKGIIDRCRSPLRIGAVLARSLPSGGRCRCGTVTLDNGALNAMGLQADKTDG